MQRRGTNIVCYNDEAKRSTILPRLLSLVRPAKGVDISPEQHHPSHESEHDDSCDGDDFPGVSDCELHSYEFISPEPAAMHWSLSPVLSEQSNGRQSRGAAIVCVS